MFECIVQTSFPNVYLIFDFEIPINSQTLIKILNQAKYFVSKFILS